MLSALVADPDAVGIDLLPLALSAFVRAAVADGDLHAAVAQADVLLAVAQRKGVWASVGQALPAIAEALHRVGRDAAELTGRYAEEVRELDVPVAMAGIRHARGVSAEAAGEHAGAAADLLAAADAYDALPLPYESAQAREAAARSLFAVDDPAAPAVLLAAVTTYQRLGARWDLDRATSLARRRGVTTPARHRGGQRGYGSDLSPREREVAELAAAGHTNREIAATLFLSAKTVDKHLSAALRKLGLRSRVTLAGTFRQGTTEFGESSP